MGFFRRFGVRIWGKIQWWRCCGHFMNRLYHGENDDREMVVHQWMEEGTVSCFWANSMWWTWWSQLNGGVHWRHSWRAFIWFVGSQFVMELWYASKDSQWGLFIVHSSIYNVGQHPSSQQLNNFWNGVKKWTSPQKTLGHTLNLTVIPKKDTVCYILWLHIISRSHGSPTNYQFWHPGTWFYHVLHLLCLTVV